MTSAKPSASTKSNDLNDQCYCSKPRNFDEIELQCWVCARWFHKSCIEIDTGPLTRFMVNYQFFCKNCNGTNQESFIKKQASFHQLCMTALANLTADKRHLDSSSQKQFFSKDKDLIPFIEKNWEAMTNAPRRTKSTWHATVSRSMTREDVFLTKIDSNETSYGLKDIAIEKVGPYNENIKLILGPSRLGNDARTGGTSYSMDSNGTRSSQNGGPNGGSTSKRGSKRKASESLSGSVNSNSYSNLAGNSSSSGQYGSMSRRKGVNDVSRLEKMVPTCYPSDHPFNKDGYRYHLVEPDPNSPLRQKFEETEMWAGKPLPGYLYRVFLEPRVSFALHDRAPQLKLSEDRLCVTGEKGYSMLRATHGAANGSWFYEITVKEKPNSSALRIGWSQELGNLQAPCGYDKFSYSWRSRKGTKFHDSIGKTYSKLLDPIRMEVSENDETAAANSSKSHAGYDVGDVLGIYIQLPLKSNSQLIPPDHKNLTLVKFKNHLYYEEKDNFTGAEKLLKPLEGSKIVFFKNGICQGVAFSDIYSGIYYPAVSLYKNASVVANFGPTFKYPLTDEQYLPYRPISDLAQEAFVEHALSDLVYHVSQEKLLE